MNAGGEAPPAKDGLLTTIAWGLPDEVDYALEAAIFVTGAAVQWLRDGLGVIGDAAETEALAASLESNDGVYFVPALTGLGSPHWDPYARGTIVGTHARHRPGAARPRGARGDRLPDRGRGPRPGGRRRRAALRAEGGRRRGRKQLADAVPGGRAGRAGQRARDLGDDRARRRVPGRDRDRRLGPGRGRLALARGSALRAADERGSSASRCSPTGAGRSSGRAAGRSRNPAPRRG